MEQVSVIIPSFNRFKYLINTILSVKQQTYKKIEIIVVNDCSTQKEYYNYNWRENGITIIHLKENSKIKFGYACGGYVRNKGIEISKGKYIAFCDDDDIWFPEKIKRQLKAMKETKCKMSSTEGLIGEAMYDENIKYKMYNSEHYFQTLYNIYENHSLSLSKINRILKKLPIIKKMVNIKSSNILKNGFPEIWTLEFIKIHNCIITSSVMIEKSILNKIGNFKNIRNAQEDYDCWLRALEHTNCVYIKDICFYYDNKHGDGQNY
tara:strand:+ start:80 stop:871 length:792 start_codon:yes stop_codon:yes gene_type:complete